MAIYTIDQQGEGNITGVTVNKIKRFGGGTVPSESVPQILLIGNTHITTDKDSNNLSQSGRSVIIDAVGNSTISVSIDSEPNFVALYIKYNIGNLTFNAEGGVSIIQAF